MELRVLGIPKVIIVIAVLIAANLLWSYIKRLKRKAEQAQSPDRTGPVNKKDQPKDDRLGDYVDYEEIKD